MKIGFAILSHDQPERLLRLVKTLTVMFNAPPIACHHDFAQCPLQRETFPKNVRFITPHIDTKWGHISQVLAALRAIRALRSGAAAPDWFVLMSGSDYPVCRAEEIVRDLDSTEYDAFLDQREIQFNKSVDGQCAKFGFGRPDWINIAYMRYCTHRFWLPSPSRRLLYSGSFPFFKRHFMIQNSEINRMLTAVQLRLRVYGGDFALQLNKRAVDGLLNSTPTLNRVIRYYQKRANPSEAFFQTILCNQADIKISAKHKRYADWTGNGRHPKWIEMADVPLILASGAHFARKFRPDGIVQEFIDRTVLGL